MTTQLRKTLAFLGVAVGVVLVDQLSKTAVLHYLNPGMSVPVLGDVLQLRLAFNDSAAFSIGFGLTWIFTIISSAAALALLWFGPKARTVGWTLLAGFLLGGVTGNLLDRLFRDPGFPNGHVIDFLQIPMNFPIFNLADCCITSTIVIAAIAVARGKKIGG